MKSISKLPLEQFLKEAFKRNKTAQTHTEVHTRAVELIRRCWAENVFIVFTDGFRTNEEQAVLFGKGRKSFIYNGKQYGNPSVKVVTNARPGQSIHNYGLALDFVTCDGYGKNIDWIVGPKWKRAAALAKELGFEWGGDWKSFYDAPHIEYNGGLQMAQIQKGLLPAFKPFTAINLDGKIEQQEEKTLSKDLLNETGRIEIRALLKKARAAGIINTTHTDEKINNYNDVQLLSYQAAVLNRMYK